MYPTGRCKEHRRNIYACMKLPVDWVKSELTFSFYLFFYQLLILFGILQFLYSLM